ncbi:hypothetical protein CH330_08865 [candidate division WOR-3 bacterium JGI_Cruoil_03_51_56]|nr:MAG: hypothetical protein CH330_08865 [candidate division WOR-3 bacterium JGI_Cruoil_03_51_56]
MGWPDETPDYKKFYPTDFLTTDPDIIFRWEARMIFSSLEFTGKIPFRDVYIHSTVLAKSGERMSRSKGVGVDPLEVIEKYGTDAVRFTITYLESQSQSYRLWDDRFQLGRNFCNKVWNACRLVYPYIAGARPEDTSWLGLTEPVDNWIRKRFNQVLEKVNQGLDRYAFSSVAATLYDFFWHDLCDWYLEFAKLRLKSNSSEVRFNLYEVVRGVLQLLHPIMPFITEELWLRLKFSKGSLLASTWPKPLVVADKDIDKVEEMRQLIVAVRNIRSDMGVPAKKITDCIVNTADKALIDFLKHNKGLIGQMARVAGLRFSGKRPARCSLAVTSRCEIYVPLENVINIEHEASRLRKEIDNLEGAIAGIDAKFANPNFERRARPEVIKTERKRKAEFQDKLARLEQQLRFL